MDRLTRQQLKQDEFRATFERFEDYLKTHYQEIAIVAIVVIAAVGLAGGLRYYLDRQEADANADLGAAFETFHAYVGTPGPNSLGPGNEKFATAEAKYKKALEQFSAMVQKYRIFPRPKAVAVARYHMGVCQAMLGDNAAAVKTLEGASHDRDREIASLSRYALADEFVKTGKLPEAIKIYEELSAHPTLSVPKDTALLGLANALRDSQPARARQVYQQLEKDSNLDSSLVEAVKREADSLSP